MSEERLMVLTMLQEGKITSEEASKLLQALDEVEIEEELHNHSENLTAHGEDGGTETQASHKNDKYTGFILEEGQEVRSSKDKITQDRIDKFNNKMKEKKDKMDKFKIKVEEKVDKIEKHKKESEDKSGNLKHLDNGSRKKMDDFGEEMDDFGEKIGAWGESFGEKAEAWGENFGEKMGNWGESFGERMGKVGEELAESATSITEKVLKMVDGFIGEGSFSIFSGSYETIIETIERNIFGIDSPILEIHGVNGKIILHSGEGDNIRIKAKCSVKKSLYDKSQPVYEVIEQDNKLVFKPRYSNGIGTSLEVYIPSYNYDKIFLLTSNGRIETSDANTNELILDTNNGSIKIQDIDSNRIIACTNNGSINIEATCSKRIELDTSNAIINVQDTSCENIIATTKNGRISIMDVQSKEISLTSSNASLRVEDSIASSIFTKTSNGSIKIYDIETSSLNRVEAYTSNNSIEINIDAHHKAYNLDAQTSMGRIDIEIPNLIYDLNKQHSPGKQKILAHSANNTEAENQVNIIASTSNGSIRII